MKPMEPMKAPEKWWPHWLGDSPNSAGGQNDVRYAYFGDKKRLAVDAGDGRASVYDTGGHEIHGVQQAQGGGKSGVVFTSQNGTVKLDELKQVDG